MAFSESIFRDFTVLRLILCFLLRNFWRFQARDSGNIVRFAIRDSAPLRCGHRHGTIRDIQAMGLPNNIECFRGRPQKGGNSTWDGPSDRHFKASRHFKAGVSLSDFGQ